ncbi:HAMP domain-containing sensor histidine kinase [Thermopolyspora sp. NPDC052614]|uniref:sensor histidine kinase n=1 Tax=Thermopolyspora sp. NPDC052614 TaxID=3155682 RepID=UPI00341D7DA5
MSQDRNQGTAGAGPGYPAGKAAGWKSEQLTVESPRASRPGAQPPPPTGPPVWDGPPPPSPIALRPSPYQRLKAISDRMSIRVRLTLIYGALFFLGGAVLLTVMYAYAGHLMDEILLMPGDVAVNPRWSPEVIDQFREVYAHEREAAIQGVQSALLRRSLLTLFGLGVIALILGYFAADRALRPVQKMTATARRLSETSLAHERIDLQGPDDELKELADTFDAMLTRLNRAFDAQRRFVDNASHELRTPLAINRTVLEVALGDPEASEDLKVLARTLLGTNARNEHLIEGLLLLARSERELSVRKEADLREVAQTAVDQLAANAAENGVTVHVNLFPARTTGDPVLLERCVSNLVENAIKYNVPEAGQLWVRTGILDGGSVVQVANTGPLVPAYEVDDLFEPFRRLNADRIDSARGAGLGLSIVRAVVRAHGGTVKAAPRDGGGLVVTVRLPQA